MSVCAREGTDFSIGLTNHLLALFCGNFRGVSAISFPVNGLHIYTAGADGMICEIDSMSGNLLNKFSATSRPISSLAVSPGTSIFLVLKSLKSSLDFFMLNRCEPLV